MDFIDGADLELLNSQHAGLQLNHSLRLTGGRLRGVCSLRLQIDARGKPPPHQASTKADQQQEHQNTTGNLPPSTHRTTSSAAA